jgi:hypothetical protein
LVVSPHRTSSRAHVAASDEPVNAVSTSQYALDAQLLNVAVNGFKLRISGHAATDELQSYGLVINARPTTVTATASITDGRYESI